jgi:glycosyltransferase involved in cell wall biosynthesis
LEQYPLTDPKLAHYTCIFVGYLRPVKRVDLILRAFAEVHKNHPEARFCIVGRGPLAEELHDLAAQLNITSVVDFVGFVPEVPPYLADAKIFVMASDSEGLPFALIEGICCGLVPVSTPVGTIGDLVINEKNGLLFPRDGWQALAQCIQRLLDEPELYEQLRGEVLRLRQNFAYDSATSVWDKWFRSFRK